jgi:hypothetical protein
MSGNSNIRAIVRGAYDIQKLRIQTGLRIVATFKKKLGQEPSTKETELDTEAKKLLAELRVYYQRITDGIAECKGRKLKQFKGEGLIDSLSEYALIDQYEHLAKTEHEQFAFLEQMLKEAPIYNEFLLKVIGVGPAMAGVIISEIDIAKAKYASSIWKYAGLDVVDGKGRSRKAEHLVDVEYKTKEGEVTTRKSITFNPFLKTKLVGVLGASFLRCKNSPYRTIYEGYKHRLENHPDHQEKTKGHRHNMAIRYMIKMFLKDLYIEWRTLEGLPVAPDYAEAKLGLKHAA